jgi:uncharacterized protein UPF0236
VDDSTTPAVLEAVQLEVAELMAELIAAQEVDLATAERTVREGVLAIGARVLAAGLAARGTGKAGPMLVCPCGAAATCEGYRTKEVQTLVGWIRVRRAYYWCAGCGHGWCPLDARLGLGRASHSAGVRRAIGRLGALLPFAQAADALAEVAGVQTAASTVRVVTEAIGTRREAELAEAVEQAWRDGVPPAEGPVPARLYVAMDGVRIVAAGGEGKEAKVGVVRPEHHTPTGDLDPAAASYVASFASAEAFGQRLALEAHRRGSERAAEVVVLGDGAEWIWNLAAEHFPDATQIVDWYHASARIWDLGRAHYGEGTAKTAAWVDRQLGRLAKGEVAGLLAAWRRLKCAATAAAVRDEQVTYFTNQASRMAYDRYRARGLDIGSGMVESACKLVIGVREKGPGMRWGVPGAQAVANVRVLLFNDQWSDYDLAA